MNITEEIIANSLALDDGNGGSTVSFITDMYTFKDICDKFLACHQDPINVLAHLITTPIGCIGALSLLRHVTDSESIGLFFFVCYMVSLLPALPVGVYVATLLMSFFVVMMTNRWKLKPLLSLVMVGFGYVAQDMAHLYTGEPTFQSSYSDGGHIDLNNPAAWSQLFFEHVYYLIPLVVHSALALPNVRALVPAWMVDDNQNLPLSLQRLRTAAQILFPLVSLAYGAYCLDTKNQSCFFPGTPYYHRVLQCNIVKDGAKNDSQKKNLQTVRKWAISQNPSPNTSSHWWYAALSDSAKTAFDACSNCPQIEKTFRGLFSEKHYAFVPVEGMNEIYVTGPERVGEVTNSDNVFYTRHVDGPWGFVPFVSIYRCIVGMDKNEMITTHFPLADLEHNACEGDVLAFDFNREVHFITRDATKAAQSDDFRVVLKLHYCIYPKILAPLGWLMHWVNVKYNQIFRALFLTTLNPSTPYQHFLAWNVNGTTGTFDFIETYIGIRSVLYLIFVASLAYLTGEYNVFFTLTSFVHYIRYITTFYVRCGIDFGSFKRDVLLFKSIALAQLFYHYMIGPIRDGSFRLDNISMGMIISGYSVSMLATKALGVDRTYFAAELGIVEPKRITEFPYGYIPHPMILSQIWALLGIMKADHFRSQWPYVVPVHVVLYVVHMLQEHFDIYDHATNAAISEFRAKNKRGKAKAT